MRWRHVTVAAFTFAAFVLTISLSALHAQSSAARTPTPAMQHPTGPPPGSPPPGSRCLGCGTAPEPVDYSDHTGWTQIFDGQSLKNWDGNPDIWKVENGAITAENWPERRIGTTYI